MLDWVFFEAEELQRYQAGGMESVQVSKHAGEMTDVPAGTAVAVARHPCGSVFQFGFRYCLRDVLLHPWMLVLVIVALVLVGFYAYQNIAVEFYYSWPYATMKADYLATANVEVQALQDSDVIDGLPSGAVCVKDYRVLAEHNGIMSEAMLHAVPAEQEYQLNQTIFNTEALQVTGIPAGGVWLDEALARRLKVSAGDKIMIVQRTTGAECSLQVEAVVPTYAPTQGILVLDRDLQAAFLAAGSSNESEERLRLSAVSLYGDDAVQLDVCLHALVGDDVAVGMQSRDEASQTARQLARRFLPFARDDLLQLAAAVLSMGIWWLYGAMTLRRQRMRFFVPMNLMGLRRSSAAAIVAAELGILAAVLCVLAGGGAVALLHGVYGLPVSAMLVVSTAGLLFGGAAVGCLGALAGFLARLRRAG